MTCSNIHHFSATHNDMETPGTGTSFKPEEAYAAAAERFFELMKTFGMGAGTNTDWKTLAAPLATQFERTGARSPLPPRSASSRASGQRPPQPRPRSRRSSSMSCG